MCGRFTLTVESIVVAERFEASLKDIQWQPRYNSAPSQPSLIIIIENTHRQVVTMTWGLIPYWSKEKKSGYQMINARIETVKSKPRFRRLFQTRRCLVPADGLFEWRKTKAGKIPYRITLKNGKLFAFAGLWDVWQGENEEKINSFTILTSDSNSIVKKLLTQVMKNMKNSIASSVSFLTKISL